MATIRIDMTEASANLRQYIAGLNPGDKIILCQGDSPVAEILPLPKGSGEPRPLGLGAGLAKVPESFFDPLPEDLLDLFEGKGY